MKLHIVSPNGNERSEYRIFPDPTVEHPILKNHPDFHIHVGESSISLSLSSPVRNGPYCCHDGKVDQLLFPGEVKELRPSEKSITAFLQRGLEITTLIFEKE